MQLGLGRGRRRAAMTSAGCGQHWVRTGTKGYRRVSNCSPHSRTDDGLLEGICLELPGTQGDQEQTLPVSQESNAI